MCVVWWFAQENVIPHWLHLIWVFSTVCFQTLLQWDWWIYETGNGEGYGVHRSQRYQANHILLTAMPFIPTLPSCQGHTMPYNTIACQAIPCNTMQYHSITCHTIPYSWSGTGKPDGVKCGFIGFSPRLNRALLMGVTTYLSNFYEQSFLNVTFFCNVDHLSEQFLWANLFKY